MDPLPQATNLVAIECPTGVPYNRKNPYRIVLFSVQSIKWGAKYPTLLITLEKAAERSVAKGALAPGHSVAGPLVAGVLGGSIHNYK